MYRDFSLSNQHELEEKLSRLESDAATILNDVKKSFENHEDHIWLNRGNRDLLRKFLFLMKYRSSTFYERYNCDVYVSDDKERMLPYMKENGFTKPLDVWFHNIRAILDLELDAEKKWTERIPKLMYPDDAIMFVFHMQSSFLAFCTPESKDAEFILTENAYGIFEGPHTTILNPETAEVVSQCFTEYHTFAPLSPKLMIVLRSHLLPGALPEATDELNAMLLKMTQSLHLDPEAAVSVLADLPIQKCRNSYSEIKDGKLVPTTDFDIHPSRHRFCFRFFRIMLGHVSTLNNLFLEEAYRSTALVFKTKQGLREILEAYLADTAPQLKLVVDVPGDPRMLFLKMLERIVVQLGGSVKAHFKTQRVSKTQAELSHMMFEKPDKERNKDFSLYKKLGEFAHSHYDVSLIIIAGGSTQSMLYDMEQASRMVNMQICLDVFMKGLDSEKKADVRRKLADFFITLPVRRVHIYLKKIRCLGRSDPRKPFSMPSSSNDGCPLTGPEDILAQGEI